MISKKELEQYYPNLSLTEDDEKLRIYKFTLDKTVRVCGILDCIQYFFYILVCDLAHKINDKK
ncbi:hypothetical protein RS022_03350 [Candidatus Phytoplasma rubi]|uniref:Uncharacterized protein n=1 Tax=Candidatus Phytoplasma rubi TaxID=399025 RepID=A0ABY7BU57_9MOLU|nr:hypothetical protein [Candidatus Phytoplasma rubi]WAN63269.1 hypothetical protein RS022_03350 [Candidatus Phytoplasma rubi]